MSLSHQYAAGCTTFAFAKTGILKNIEKAYDVILVGDNHEYRCHQIIVMNGSPRIEELISTAIQDLDNFQDGILHVDIPGLSHLEISMALHYIYGRHFGDARADTGDDEKASLVMLCKIYHVGMELGMVGMSGYAEKRMGQILDYKSEVLATWARYRQENGLPMATEPGTPVSREFVDRLVSAFQYMYALPSEDMTQDAEMKRLLYAFVIANRFILLNHAYFTERLGLLPGLATEILGEMCGRGDFVPCGNDNCTHTQCT